MRTPLRVFMMMFLILFLTSPVHSEEWGVGLFPNLTNPQSYPDNNRTLQQDSVSNHILRDHPDTNLTQPRTTETTVDVFDHEENILKNTTAEEFDNGENTLKNTTTEHDSDEERNLDEEFEAVAEADDFVTVKPEVTDQEMISTEDVTTHRSSTPLHSIPEVDIEAVFGPEVVIWRMAETELTVVEEYEEIVTETTEDNVDQKDSSENSTAGKEGSSDEGRYLEVDSEPDLQPEITDIPGDVFTPEAVTNNQSTTEASPSEVPTNDISTSEAPLNNVSISKALTINDLTSEVSSSDVSNTEVPPNDVSTSEVRTNDVSISEVTTNDISTSEVTTVDVSVSEVPPNDVSTSEALINEIFISDAPSNDISTSEAPTNTVSLSEVTTSDISVLEVTTNDVKISEMPTTEAPTNIIYTPEIPINNVSYSEVSTQDISSSDDETNTPAGTEVSTNKNTASDTSAQFQLDTLSILGIGVGSAVFLALIITIGLYLCSRKQRSGSMEFSVRLRPGSVSLYTKQMKNEQKRTTAELRMKSLPRAREGRTVEI